MAERSDDFAPGRNRLRGIPILQLSTTPGHLIRRAQQVHTAYWFQRLQGELTGPQYSVLVSLAQQPGIDQTGVADLASLDKNTTADIVGRMIDRGWVERAVDPSDRRRRLLTLTSSARAAMRRITPRAELVQQDLLSPLPPADRDSTVDLLSRVAYFQTVLPPLRTMEDVPALSMPRTPGYLIRRIQRIETAIWARRVGAELTGPQYAVLVALVSSPGIDQVTLGSLASLDKSSVADIVSRLSRRGWIDRRNQPDHGRRSQLSISTAARDALRRITPLAADVQRDLLIALDAGQAARLVDKLAVVAYAGDLPT